MIDRIGASAFLYACERGDEPIARMMLAHSRVSPTTLMARFNEDADKTAGASETHIPRRTALHAVAANGLKKLYADIVEDPRFRTLLHCADKQGQTADQILAGEKPVQQVVVDSGAVKRVSFALAEVKADPSYAWLSAGDAKAPTALMAAVYKKDKDAAMKILKDQDASVTAQINYIQPELTVTEVRITSQSLPFPLPLPLPFPFPFPLLVDWLHVPCSMFPSLSFYACLCV